MKMTNSYPSLISQWIIAGMGTLAFLLCLTVPAMGQDKPERVYMYLNYFQSDDEQYLISELKWRDGKNFKQLADKEVHFYFETDTSDVLFAIGTTAENGQLKLDLKQYKIFSDSSGLMHFKSEFEGDDQFKDAKKATSVKEIKLNIAMETIDSVFQLKINGNERLGKESVPIDGSDIQILVKRLYSDLPVIKGTLEEGVFASDFPDDLPGDAKGDIWVIARIKDHDDFGTVETRKKVNWGVPVSFDLEESPRALWSRAPVWIIVAVWIAFILVWYHYFLSISSLFKMKSA